MAKLSSMKKTATCPPSAVARAFQPQDFVDDALVRSETDGVSKEPGHRAKVTAVRTPATGLNRHQVETGPGNPSLADQIARPFWNLRDQIELGEIHLLPRDTGIVFQGRFDLFPGLINRQVDLFELSGLTIAHDLRPERIRLTQSDGIRVPGLGVAANGLVGNLRDVRTSHDHFGALPHG